MDGKEESQRLSSPEQAPFAPGFVTRALSAPRHEVTNGQYQMILGGIGNLDRNAPSLGRQLMAEHCGILLVKSLQKQGVLPQTANTRSISAGFDPEAPFPTLSGYNPVARDKIVHLFCGNAVIAFFFMNHATGHVSEAYCVKGCLSDFDPSFDADNACKWGRVWAVSV